MTIQQLESEKQVLAYLVIKFAEKHHRLNVSHVMYCLLGLDATKSLMENEIARAQVTLEYDNKIRYEEDNLNSWLYAYNILLVFKEVGLLESVTNWDGQRIEYKPKNPDFYSLSIRTCQYQKSIYVQNIREDNKPKPYMHSHTHKVGIRQLVTFIKKYEKHGKI